MEGPFRTGMILSALMLGSLAGWRWYEAAARAPDRITGLEGGGVVFLVRSDDCPDRRAAMGVWLAREGWSREGSGPVRAAVGVVDEGDPLLDDRLSSLPMLGARDVDAAGRALLRQGLAGTPALVVVDENGFVVMVEAFTPKGPGGRLELVAKVAPRIATTTGSTPEGA